MKFEHEVVRNLRKYHNYTLHLCFLFISLFCSHFVTDMIRKLELHLLVVLVLLKSKLVFQKSACRCQKHPVSNTVDNIAGLGDAFIKVS